MKTLEERFWEKVSGYDDNGCRLWLGAGKVNGYGIIKIDGKSEMVHRVSWKLSSGLDIPEGMNVLHTCDIKRCVEFSHLWIGTQQDNVIDMHSKHRDHNFTGENGPSSKLSWDIVIEIRNYYNNYNVTHNEIARFFNISRPCVSNILNNKTWIK